MKQLLTSTQIEIWKNKVLGKKIGLIWHSIGTFIWIDLGDVTGKSLGTKGYYDTYEFTVHTTRWWIIKHKERVILEIEDSTPNVLINEALDELNNNELTLVDLAFFEKTAKIVLSDGYEIVLKQSSADDELAIAFPNENRYIYFDQENNGYIQNLDDPA